MVDGTEMGSLVCLRAGVVTKLALYRTVQRHRPSLFSFNIQENYSPDMTPRDAFRVVLEYQGQLSAFPTSCNPHFISDYHQPRQRPSSRSIHHQPQMYSNTIQQRLWVPLYHHHNDLVNRIRPLSTLRIPQPGYLAQP